METFFEISDSEDFVKVEVLDYITYSSALDWDKNWIKASVSIKAGGFTGQYAAEFMTVDFKRFEKDFSALYDNLSGGAVFHDLEGYLQLKVLGDGIGHFNLNVEACDKPGIYGVKLIFELNFDQTFIKPIARQLKEITDTFPVVGNLERY